MNTSEAKAIRRRAAEWLAHRQAGGFTPAEERAFAAWLAADPRHAAAFRQLESAWAAFDRLADYPRAEGVPADANFFAGRAPFLRRCRPALLAAAAAFVLGSAVWLRTWQSAHPAGISPAAAADPNFLRLSDDSVVELHPGSEVAEDFTPGERRVRLVRGEAQFSVTKNPARPFIVEAGGVAVRAVGTAFDVRLGAATVDVLVTEGTVQVNRPTREAGPANAGPAAPLVLVAGQRTVVSTNPEAPATKSRIETLANSEIDQALAWQASRLVFDATPLSEIVERVNLRSINRRGFSHLSLGDPEVGEIRVSGRIRSDDVGSFVEALQSGFGVSVERRAGGEIILRTQPRNLR